MTRIQFTSAIDYAAVATPIPLGADKGIESHGAVWAFFQNLAALFKICSPIFEYKISQDTTLYLNLTSFNNWLGRHSVVPKMEMGKTDTDIVNLVSTALGGGRAPVQNQVEGDPANNSGGGDPVNKGTGETNLF